jgi:hypothetical protein
MARDQDVLGIGMVGYAFMGRAHSQAWRNVASFFELPCRPRMAAICGRDPDAVAAAAARLGWPGTETDWKRLVERDDVDLVAAAATAAWSRPQMAAIRGRSGSSKKLATLRQAWEWARPMNA